MTYFWFWSLVCSVRRWTPQLYLGLTQVDPRLWWQCCHLLVGSYDWRWWRPALHRTTTDRLCQWRHWYVGLSALSHIYKCFLCFYLWCLYVLFTRQTANGFLMKQWWCEDIKLWSTFWVNFTITGCERKILKFTTWLQPVHSGYYGLPVPAYGFLLISCS